MVSNSLKRLEGACECVFISVRSLYLQAMELQSLEGACECVFISVKSLYLQAMELQRGGDMVDWRAAACGPSQGPGRTGLWWRENGSACNEA